MPVPVFHASNNTNKKQEMAIKRGVKIPFLWTNDEGYLRRIQNLVFLKTHGIRLLRGRNLTAALEKKREPGRCPSVKMKRVKKEKINPRSTHAARLTNNPKTNIVVTVVGSVPVPIGRPRVPGIVVPRATTQHTIPSISQALKTRTW